MRTWLRPRAGPLFVMPCPRLVNWQKFWFVAAARLGNGGNPVPDDRRAGGMHNTIWASVYY